MDVWENRQLCLNPLTRLDRSENPSGDHSRMKIVLSGLLTGLANKPGTIRMFGKAKSRRQERLSASSTTLNPRSRFQCEQRRTIRTANKRQWTRITRRLITRICIRVYWRPFAVENSAPGSATLVRNLRSARQELEISTLVYSIHEDTCRW